MTTQAHAAPRVRGETARAQWQRRCGPTMVVAPRHRPKADRRRQARPDLPFDLHLVHEGDQFPAGFRRASGSLNGPHGCAWPDLTIATEDHKRADDSTSTSRSPTRFSRNPRSRTLRRNWRRVRHPSATSDGATPSKAIVHIIGPQLGLTQPGTTVGVRGNSHNLNPRGAFGAFGDGHRDLGGSSMVLATQTLPLAAVSRTMAVQCWTASCPPGC